MRAELEERNKQLAAEVESLREQLKYKQEVSTSSELECYYICIRRVY